MRPTFALNLDCRPISVNAPKTTPHTFQVGDVFWLTADYPYEYGAVPEGTKLFVSHVSDDDGTMWLLAEGDVPALWHCDNMLVAAPYDTEDLLPYLRAAVRCPAVTYLEPEEAPSVRVHRLQFGKLALAACFIVSSWALPQRVTVTNHFIHQNSGFHASVGTTQAASG